MLRNIKIKINDKNIIIARACRVVKTLEYEVEVSSITAIDIKSSKSIETMLGDFGIVMFNEFGFGFMVSWGDFEDLQATLQIKEEQYEAFLDNFINCFSDTVIEIINNDEK